MTVERWADVLVDRRWVRKRGAVVDVILMVVTKSVTVITVPRVILVGILMDPTPHVDGGRGTQAPRNES